MCRNNGSFGSNPFKFILQCIGRILQGCQCVSVRRPIVAIRSFQQAVGHAAQRLAQDVAPHGLDGATPRRAWREPGAPASPQALAAPHGCPGASLELETPLECIVPVWGFTSMLFPRDRVSERKWNGVRADWAVGGDVERTDRGADTGAADTPSSLPHAVFLCELGSQKRHEKIDAVFQKHAAAVLGELQSSWCTTACEWDEAAEQVDAQLGARLD